MGKLEKVFYPHEGLTFVRVKHRELGHFPEILNLKLKILGVV